MTLRRAKISDASSIAALSIEVWVGTYLKSGVSAFFADFVLNAFSPSNIEKLLRDPDNFIFVSENDEGIDGYICIAQNRKAPVETGSDIEISTFYVQPRHHGKGIGKRLLNAAFQVCREQGASSVWLTTNAENDPAIEFYIAKGFRQIGETYFSIQDQNYLNNVYEYRFAV